MKQVIVMGLIFAIMRVSFAFVVPPDTFSWFQVYKDLAHLFMGGLSVAWWIQRNKWQWNLFWLMNFIEVATAILTRF